MAYSRIPVSSQFHNPKDQCNYCNLSFVQDVARFTPGARDMLVIRFTVTNMTKLLVSDNNYISLIYDSFSANT
jgi:curli biogenesis system outer membrane secretion channel CsgG